jgi:chromosome segregation ATPase
MSDITELERRITAALDRIGNGLEDLETPAPSGPDPETLAALTAAQAQIADLTQALSDEKLASAQHEERLKSVRETSERHQAAMDIQVFEQQKSAATLDAELQRLRRACEELRASNISLRSALEEGMADPHMINKAMLAELETLRAARSVEMAQADAVLAAIEPLVKQAGWESSQDSAAAQNPNLREQTDA